MRYVLIDYMHLAHRCIAMDPLSTTVKINGEIQLVDTTIPNYTIKNIYRYGGKGRYYVAVCFEGGSAQRKAYFSALGSQDKSTSYKGTRNRQQNAFYTGVDLTIQSLVQGNTSVYRVQGIESDDCIASLVTKIKSVDQTTPIDIITNDSDLLPLVDDQVSVYMRGNRGYAEPGCPEHRLYYQVTPRTWTDYLSYTSAYRKFLIPYNSMLLFKLIRGDSSDNVAGATKGYGGVKYTKLMEQMIADGVDFPNIFRYGVDFDLVIRPVLENYFDGTIEGLTLNATNWSKFKNIHRTDEAYVQDLTVSTVDYMKFIYGGISPIPVSLQLPKMMDLGAMQVALSPLKINLLKA